MNSARTLYSILNLIIILIIITIGLSIILFALIVFDVIPKNSVEFDSNILLYKSDPGLYIFTTLTLLIYGIFMFGIWKLKKATKLLLENNFYNLELIKNIIISGKCMVLTGVFAWLIDGLSSAYFKQAINIQLSDKTFVYLFIIAMGLFMMLIGKVITDAKNIKQENELTI